MANSGEDTILANGFHAAASLLERVGASPLFHALIRLEAEERARQQQTKEGFTRDRAGSAWEQAVAHQFDADPEEELTGASRVHTVVIEQKGSSWIFTCDNCQTEHPMSPGAMRVECVCGKKFSFVEPEAKSKEEEQLFLAEVYRRLQNVREHCRETAQPGTAQAINDVMVYISTGGQDG